MENTYGEYEEWCEEVDSNIQRSYKAALEKLKILEPFENKLVSTIQTFSLCKFCLVCITRTV